MAWVSGGSIIDMMSVVALYLYHVCYCGDSGVEGGTRRPCWYLIVFSSKMRYDLFNVGDIGVGGGNDICF